MRVIDNYSLAEWNTFGLEAKARKFCEYSTVEELKEILRLHKGEKFLHIGRGSNLLFINDFDGIVLHSAIGHIEVVEEQQDAVIVSVGAGVMFDKFVEYCVEHAWWGIENLSYIPGEVGASAVQNIGAYGVEAKDVIYQVETLHVGTQRKRIFTNAECKYAYRDSVFKNRLKGKYVVTSVRFRLHKQPCPKLASGSINSYLPLNPSLADIRQVIINIRRQKLPEVNDLGSAGSFFKNPVVSKRLFYGLKRQYPDIPYYDLSRGVKIPAAWLISNAGLKGRAIGGAKVYEKQPLVIVNTGAATAHDIVALACMIQAEVKRKFDIDLFPEVNYIS